MSAPLCGHATRNLGAVCCDRCEREAIIWADLARACALPCRFAPCRCAVQAAKLAAPPRRQLALGGIS